MFTLNQILEHYGKKILYRNTRDRWVETFLNNTYAELMMEFPEDYKLVN